MLPFPHKRGVLLKEVSSFGIGGPADYFAEAKSQQEMQTMLSFCHQEKIPFFILGKGSNCLFDDRGFNGLVILNRIDSLLVERSLFTVGAGFSFARLGKEASRRGFTGLEFASGIPATVGGAIYMNAGASGQETKTCLLEIGYVTDEGDLKRFKKDELEFGYRFSSFQRWKGAIVEGVFQLEPFSEAKMKQQELLAYRLKTQPYKDKSAGCAFRNPPGQTAGRLIDECGLKGFAVGGAKVSTLHGNFIVNAGDASAQDVMELMHLVKEKILQKTGICLEEEICYIPYETR